MATVQVIPLGGVGEIGKNCTAVRQGDDIVVVDCGLSFPSEEMPGVDIVIPDFTYLIENRNKVRGIFITHAHEDHVGALPYLLPKLQVPVFASKLALALIRPKLEEKIGLKGLDLREFSPGDDLPAGAMTVEPVRVTHSIPETCSMAVKTDHGIVLFTADFKLDFTPVDGKLSNIQRLGELGREGVIALLSDCTNAEEPGWSPSEATVKEGLRRAFASAPGRVLLTTFASNIHRMQQTLDVAHETGRKVAIAGRRMEQTIETCSKLGYIRIPPGLMIHLRDSSQYPPQKLAILTTGTQGEPLSALVQMSKGEYSRLKIVPGDTVLYSARPIPGNEASIWRTVNRLFRAGANVIYQAPTPIHVSGHAHMEELKMMINLTRPYYVAPVHGEPRHQHRYLQMARQMGYPEHRAFLLTDGVPLSMDDTRAWLDDPVPYGRVLVDNSGEPGLSDDVLRDRTNLANEGFVIVTVVVDADKGEIVGPAVVQHRGVHGDQGQIVKLPDAVADALTILAPDDVRDVDTVRREVADTTRHYLQKRMGIRPVVIPIVVEV